MCHLWNRHSRKYPLCATWALVLKQTAVFLLLTHCGGQAEMIGSPTPILAMIGEDVTLPCRLQPAADLSPLTLEWARLDLNPRFVHVRRDGVELLVNQNPSFLGRTSLSSEKLKHGDMSLRLSKVKLSDEGKYRCHIPGQGSSMVELVVGAASSPVIIIKEIADDELALQCESKGWYPEPGVLWLDSEGNLLSDQPTETLRGPDGLFTVSSKLTVMKRQSDVLTCRVQQKNITQTRETGIQIQDVSLCVAPSGSVARIIVVLFIGFLLLSAVFCLLWRLRQNRGNDKVQRDKETPKGREEEEQLLKGCKTTKDLDSELQEKEEENKDIQDVILILEEQKTELENSRAKLKSKVEKVEKEWRENETKLKKVNNRFSWDKDLSENSLLKLKMELENKNTEFKKSLASIEKKIQKWLVMISKIEDKKKKVEKQIDEIKKAINEAKMQQVEKEKEEGKMKLQNIKESFHSNKPDETNPRSEINIEQEKTEHLKLLDSTEENVQGSMDMISVVEEQKTEPGSTRTEQKSKQKKVEKEKGEIKKKLKKVKESSHLKNPEQKGTNMQQDEVQERVQSEQADSKMEIPQHTDSM